MKYNEQKAEAFWETIKRNPANINQIINQLVSSVEMVESYFRNKQVYLQQTKRNCNWLWRKQHLATLLRTTFRRSVGGTDWTVSFSYGRLPTGTRRFSQLSVQNFHNCLHSAEGKVNERSAAPAFVLLQNSHRIIAKQRLHSESKASEDRVVAQKCGAAPKNCWKNKCCRARQPADVQASNVLETLCK